MVEYKQWTRIRWRLTNNVEVSQCAPYDQCTGQQEMQMIASATMGLNGVRRLLFVRHVFAYLVRSREA